MKFERLFTKKATGQYEGIEWAARKSEISNPDGKPVFIWKEPSFLLPGVR